MEADEDTEPLKILVFDTDSHRRAVRAHGLANFGHRCEHAWSFDQVATLVMPGRIDALLAAIGPGQLPLRGFTQLFDRFRPVRQTALVALTMKFVHDQAEKLRQTGFDVALHEPISLSDLESAVRGAALPLRGLPSLDRARRKLIRAEQGEGALDTLEQGVQAAAEHIITVIEAAPAILADAATILAETCTAAGMPAAAQAARDLAADPERPYLQRALANALAGARSAARAERLRRAAEGIS